MRSPDWQSEDGRQCMWCGDMLDVLPGIDDKIDTIITDPPYGLEFMGKDWDHGVPGVALWQAISAVCKPGAMMLAFGGTRTFHRLTCGIEDGGWEIRDCMMWLYGSGFPKSLDISKGIDKAAGAVRDAVGINPSSRPNSKKHNGGGFDSQQGNNSAGIQVLTVPATDAARLWNGWGTAMKPAWEPVIVAMKPLDGTFAENAQKHGVAGLNIDGSRIAAIDFEPKDRVGAAKLMEDRPWQDEQKKNGRPRIVEGNSLGRWPANLILDVKAAEMLDKQSGEGFGKRTAVCDNRSQINGSVALHDTRSLGRRGPDNSYTDSGGASRFFYCAKASKSERGPGNNHPTVKPLALMEYLCKLTATPTGGLVLDPFMGSGTTGIACVKTGRRFIGIEKGIKYFNIARERMEKAIAEQGLFGSQDSPSVLRANDIACKAL